MRLTIRRDQVPEKGILGAEKGFLFQIWCRIELTDEEQSIVDKYRAADYVVATVRDQAGKTLSKSTLREFAEGVTYQMRDIQELLAKETEVKDSAQMLVSLLTVMATFGGEEVFEC